MKVEAKAIYEAKVDYHNAHCPQPFLCLGNNTIICAWAAQAIELNRSLKEAESFNF